MFVVRNSGNMIPRSSNYGISGYEVSITTEPAALELAVKRGKIQHVIVCGHSDCKAINTLYNLHQCPKNFDQQSPMDHWLRKHGYNSINKLLKLNESLAVDKSKAASEVIFSSEILKFNIINFFFFKLTLLFFFCFSFSAYIDPEQKLGIEDKLSQINTLEQLLNISSHEFLHNFLNTGKVQIHAFWFDVYSGNLYMFSKINKSFILVNDETAHQLLSEVNEEKKIKLKN